MKKATTTKSKKSFNEDEIAYMLATYRRILTPAEWEERARRFVSGPADVHYNDKGILVV